MSYFAIQFKPFSYFHITNIRKFFNYQRIKVAKILYICRFFIIFAYKITSL